MICDSVVHLGSRTVLPSTTNESMRSDRTFEHVLPAVVLRSVRVDDVRAAREGIETERLAHNRQIHVHRGELHGVRDQCGGVGREKHQRKQEQQHDQENHAEAPDNLLRAASRFSLVFQRILLRRKRLEMKITNRSDLVFSDEHGVSDLFDAHVVPDIAGRFGDGPVNQAVEFVEEGDHAIHHVNHIRLH